MSCRWLAMQACGICGHAAGVCLDAPHMPLATLPHAQNMFDAAYNGNRGPVTVAIHSPYLEAKGGWVVPWRLKGERGGSKGSSQKLAPQPALQH